MFVASEPAVSIAPIYYRHLEIEKDVCLKAAQGDFDAPITLSALARQHIQWWHANLHTAVRPITRPDPQLTFFSDSSSLGWGGVDGNNPKRTVGGTWSAVEAPYHINYKELHAAFLTLKTFAADARNVHVRLHVDNSTAVSYINHMGGRKRLLNDLTRDIWLWANDRGLWLSAVHIAGRDNFAADRESRKFGTLDTEWALTSGVFAKLNALWGPFQCDLFASRINHKLSRYVSWGPDPGSYHMDAFTLSWEHLYSYCFPPFSLIGRVLAKLEKDHGEMVLVAPLWPTQHWFAKLLKLTVAQPVLLPPHHVTLILPSQPKRRHPLGKHLKLAGFRLSGKVSISGNTIL